MTIRTIFTILIIFLRCLFLTANSSFRSANNSTTGSLSKSLLSISLLLSDFSVLFSSNNSLEPRRSITETSKISAILFKVSASGTEIPFSHLDTVWRVTPSFNASVSCVILWEVRKYLIVLLSILFGSLHYLYCLHLNNRLHHSIAQATHINILRCTVNTDWLELKKWWFLILSD